MELKDTVALMFSSDYRERFKAEYYQLQIRAAKLSSMLKAHRNGELNFELSCPYELLVAQRAFMQCYIDILESRAQMEDIRVEDITP